MKFGLSENIISSINTFFENNFRIDEVIIFGSRAKGNYREDSDIDLAVKGRNIEFKDILRLNGQLDELSLPYTIDLLNYNTIKDKDVIEHIDRVGIVFYEKWKEFQLKKIGCKFLSGFAFKSQDYKTEGIPLIKIGNIQNRIVEIDLNGDFIKEEVITQKISEYFLNDKDVLIAMTGQGSVGRVGRLKLKSAQKALLNQRVGKFICDEQSLNVDYLYYILTTQKYQDYLFNTGSGSGQPNLSPNLILETAIPWTNYTNQLSIASILSSLDDKIDLLQRQNKTLEQLAETLFRQWFLEEVGKKWEIGIVSDLFILQRGHDLPSQNRISGKYAIMSSGGENGFHNEYKVKGPGVSTGRSGLIGNVFYIDNDFWPLNTSLFIKEYKIATPLFSYFFLKTIDLKSLNGGSAVPTLNRNDVHDLRTMLPPKELIIKFELTARNYFLKIKSNTNQLKLLIQLRDTLLPKLMSGEVRVKLN